MIKEQVGTVSPRRRRVGIFRRSRRVPQPCIAHKSLKICKRCRLAATTINLMPVFAHQADVTNRIEKRSNFAAFIGVDCSNRYKTDSEPLVPSQNYALTLKPEAIFSRQQNRQQFFTYEAEPTLAIGKCHFADFPDLPGHELIGPSANERHRFKIIHAVANNQFRLRTIYRFKKCRDIRRIMLTVPFEAKIERYVLF